MALKFDKCVSPADKPSGPLSNLTIDSPKLLLVEGIDEYRVFESLAEQIGVSGIQTIPYGGRPKLRSLLRTLVALSGFADVESLAIVMDADTSSSGSIQSICGSLASVGLPVPQGPLIQASTGNLKVTYLVLPGGTSPGMLEDVCLSSAASDPAMNCVDAYFKCIAATSLSGPRHNHRSKARVHTFLASRSRPGLRLGEAAEAGIWPFHSPAFDPLKRLLQVI